MRIDTRFEAIVFDWDGTAVPDRESDGAGVRRLIEAGCAAGLHYAIVSGTHVGNVDGQLRARPEGPGRLLLALNRGSQVFEVGADGPQLVACRTATPEEDAALDRAAALTVARLAERGFTAAIVSQRLNRRKVDLIPVPEWADPPKAEIDRLLAAVQERLDAAGIGSLPDVVALAEQAARDSGLADPKVSSDAKHVEIGLTDKGDSSEWVFEWLRARGVGAGLVLVAGDEVGPLGGLPGSDSRMLGGPAARATAISVGVEPTGVPDGVLHLPGGPARFVKVLADQLERRRRGDVPEIDTAPGWTLVVDGIDPEQERAHAALLTIADGRIGSTGGPTVPDPSAAPCLVTAGVYDGTGNEVRLLEGPVWYRIGDDPTGGRGVRRLLDLRTGLLRETAVTGRGANGDDGAGEYRSLRFSSLGRPGTVALRLDHNGAVGRAERLLELPNGARPTEEFVAPGEHAMRLAATEAGGVAICAHERTTRAAGGGGRERIAVYVTDPDTLPELAVSRAAALDASRVGFDRILNEHREAWATRWEDADIAIDGDDEMQLAVRGALYHLFSAVTDRGEAAVGARGLSGHGYGGHVFWDSDVFVLPVLAATHPPAARAMLEYRVRRLPAARAAAAEEGHQGARFPWESARTGRDVTPTFARDLAGNVIPIRTGQLEIHIVACVAWAAATYVEWTGDATFAAGPGRTLLIETARFWASRIREDSAAGHIYGVIGPDEYHEPVDDSAFTNVMARWNLRRAAAALIEYPDGDEAVDPAECRRWLELADRLIDGYDPVSRVYEEFAGFHVLEPLLATRALPRRPITADLLLGRERVQGSQIVKQADVLMLHHMVPTEVERGSLVPNLDYYEPRTSHGSSLSPAIHAALMARAGRPDAALETLRMAADIDLHDTTETTAGGVHMATLAGIWHAIVYGFCGVRPRGDALRIEPCLPTEWHALDVRFRFHGRRVRLQIDADTARVSADRPVHIVTGSDDTSAGPEGVLIRREHDTWKVES